MKHFLWSASFLFLLLMGCQSQNVISSENDREAVEAILANLDNLSLAPEQQLENYTEDAVILAPNQKEIRGHAALKSHLEGFGSGVDLTINHEIVEYSSFDDVVIVQGRVVGTAKPENDPNTYPFETKNIILFKRSPDKGLKIWKVIYNSAPVEEG